MRLRVSYCRQGNMSQCVADNYGEQLACSFSDKATADKRCMHRNENMDNHCWSPKAQAYSREHGVVRMEDVEGEEYSIEDFLEDPPSTRRNCHSCVMYACYDVVQAAADASDRGGLTDGDLWEIGSNCKDYIDEATMRDSYST